VLIVIHKQQLPIVNHLLWFHIWLHITLEEHYINEENKFFMTWLHALRGMSLKFYVTLSFGGLCLGEKYVVFFCHYGYNKWA